MNTIHGLEALRSSLLTAELSEDETQALADRMGVKTLCNGEVLVAEGDLCQTLFLQAAGAIQLYRDCAGDEEILYQMHLGECVGTRSFVDGSAYVFGLRSIGDSTVLTLDSDALDTLDQEHPRLLYKIMRAFVLITHVTLARLRLEDAELRHYVLKSGGRY
ncbi:Crp/Fnr family transcriptional regulator [Thiocapsa imhoffii]|uniref:Crp/Fnr family transcriptional regulator n=1 Tax=Thiocapsa imhoffii TaxID=382777 RepID=A0A9X0WJ54_9GAMM|nr:Crp/Fnr family transcriptional regulator [Thiocapsa imhoffii]MBK1645506.1 Crp/Fnr family transcriptional regulator [Thiocapsa imhoffii]